MSTTITGRTSYAIHLTYTAATYEVGQLGQYLMCIDEAWGLVIKLATYRTNNPLDEAPTRHGPLPPGMVLMLPAPYDDPASVEGEDLTARGPAGSLRSSRRTSSQRESLRRLKVERIQLNSPLDITLALETAGSTGVIVYAMYLLGAVLRDPERIGGWLPRLAAGWHKGRLEARQALQARRDAVIAETGADPVEEYGPAPGEAALIDARMYESVTQLVDLSRDLKGLQPADVTVDVDAEGPEEIARVLEEVD